MTKQEIAKALDSHAWCIEYVVEALRMERSLTESERHNYKTSIDAMVTLLAAARGAM